MIDLIVFGLFIMFGAVCLVVWPLLLHPTLPLRQKLWLSIVAVFILVPAGIALYVWLGVPQMARFG
jgi:hypothetical protein